MADIKKTDVDEIAELRERVKSLESELAKERDKDKKEKKKKERTWGNVFEDAADEVNKVSLALLWAGLESVALTADYTRALIDKTADLNKGEKRDTVTKKLLYLPLDLGEGLFHAIDKSTEMPGKLVDKFNEKYEEKTT
jgi:hypothetical protein